jgi:hypothetical protein
VAVKRNEGLVCTSKALPGKDRLKKAVVSGENDDDAKKKQRGCLSEARA